jgi:hypothetical protein
MYYGLDTSKTFSRVNTRLWSASVDVGAGKDAVKCIETCGKSCETFPLFLLADPDTKFCFRPSRGAAHSKDRMQKEI